MRCFFNILMNSCTCGSIISFEGEIGIDVNDLVNRKYERGHNWLVKFSIRFYSLPDARLLCQ